MICIHVCFGRLMYACKSLLTGIHTCVPSPFRLLIGLLSRPRRSLRTKWNAQNTGRLAAAVSNAGGIGLVGSGGHTIDFLRTEWRAAQTCKHNADLLGFGMNIKSLDSLPADTLGDLVRELRPAHVYLSFGSLEKYAREVLDNGAALYSNAGDVAVALQHASHGATCVVLQGSDAGGHTHHRASLMALLPECRSALDDAGFTETLLVAAGGVADGRGMAGSLVLGADAVILGTRLAAAEESDYSDTQKAALVQAKDGANTTTLGFFHDALLGIEEHSSGLPGRCLITDSSALQRRWEQADAAEREAIKKEHQNSGRETTWAGAAVGLIKRVQPAAEILNEVTREAVTALQGGNALVKAA